LWDTYNGQLAAGLMTSTSRVLLNYCQQQFEIKNNCNNIAKVKIYDCVARDEDSVSPSSDWWGGSHGVDGTPKLDPAFGVKWRIYKVTTVSIAPGATHYHKKVVKWNKFVEKRDFMADNVNVDGHPIADLTTATMIVHYGGLVDDDGGASNIVTQGPCKLICRVRTLHEGRMVPYNGRNKAESTALATELSSVNLENEDQDEATLYEDA